MTEKTGQAKFLTGNLTQHIISMSLTSAIGFLALFIVDLVDMLFISMLGIDELAAAVGFAGAVLFLTTSISIGMAIAGGAMVARSLGENKPERATELLTHVLVVGVAFAVVFASVIYANFFVDKIMCVFYPSLCQEPVFFVPLSTVRAKFLDIWSTDQ